MGKTRFLGHYILFGVCRYGLSRSRANGYHKGVSNGIVFGKSRYATRAVKKQGLKVAFKRSADPFGCINNNGV